MMRVLLPLLLIMASAGFALSLVVHLFAMLRLPEPLGENTVMLVPPLLLVMLVAGILVFRLRKGYPATRGLYAALRGCPRWMREVLFCALAYFFLYLVLSFFISIPPAIPGRPGPPQLYEVLSACWMGFYAWSAAIISSATAVLNQARRSDVRKDGR